MDPQAPSGRRGTPTQNLAAAASPPLRSPSIPCPVSPPEIRSASFSSPCGDDSGYERRRIGSPLETAKGVRDSAAVALTSHRTSHTSARQRTDRFAGGEERDVTAVLRPTRGSMVARLRVQQPPVAPCARKICAVCRLRSRRYLQMLTAPQNGPIGDQSHSRCPIARPTRAFAERLARPQHVDRIRVPRFDTARFPPRLRPVVVVAPRP